MILCFFKDTKQDSKCFRRWTCTGDVTRPKCLSGLIVLWILPTQFSIAGTIQNLSFRAGCKGTERRFSVSLFYFSWKSVSWFSVVDYYIYVYIMVCVYVHTQIYVYMNIYIHTHIYKQKMYIYLDMKTLFICAYNSWAWALHEQLLLLHCKN